LSQKLLRKYVCLHLPTSVSVFVFRRVALRVDGARGPLQRLINTHTYTWIYSHTHTQTHSQDTFIVSHLSRTLNANGANSNYKPTISAKCATSILFRTFCRSSLSFLSFPSTHISLLFPCTVNCVFYACVCLCVLFYPWRNFNMAIGAVLCLFNLIYIVKWEID